MLTFRGLFFPETVPPPHVHASLRIKAMIWPSLFCVKGYDECFWGGAVVCVGVHDAEVWCSKMARMGGVAKEQRNSHVAWMLHAACCMLRCSFLTCQGAERVRHRSSAALRFAGSQIDSQMRSPSNKSEWMAFNSGQRRTSNMEFRTISV